MSHAFNNRKYMYQHFKC